MYVKKNKENEDFYLTDMNQTTECLFKSDLYVRLEVNNIQEIF